MAQEPQTHPQRPVKRPGQKFPLWIMWVSIAVFFGWLLFLAFWLFYYASGFSILQNIAVLLLSIVVALIVETLLWVPWTMKRA
ncbi:MAG: hypothetical protein WBZ42_11105 [Halobacteriota archaeon]